MTEPKVIDAIAYAWKLCNPRVPMPPQLGPDRAGLLRRGIS